MQKWIITGGAGFIGCNFVRSALASNEVEKVLVLDKLTYAGHLENLAEVERDARYRFERADICDRAALGRIFTEFQPTAIINFAAESHVDRSIDGPGAFVQTNIVGTFELLEVARAFLAEAVDEARRPFRFVHVSTDEVYGALGREGLFSETTSYAPNSPYAASKAAADHLVRAYFKTYGLPVLLTNCSNNYGPFQFPEKLIPLMILNAAEGRPLPIYGDGQQIRDWLHVEDHCTGILQVLKSGRLGEKYNIGGHNERANIDVVGRICELLEAEMPAAENPALAAVGATTYHDLKTFVDDRPGHDRRYAIDSSKIQRELGWKARYNFETGMQATVRWYLANRAWCQSVQEGTYTRERLGLTAESAASTATAAH